MDEFGILALEAYIPNQYISHTELEKHDFGESYHPKNGKRGLQGKYVLGLGQTSMAFASDREDTVSICMTALSLLFKRIDSNPGLVSLANLGRLEVGTEGPVDKSKSIKSFLMPLLSSKGIHNLAGADCINACVGGTVAVTNSIDWLKAHPDPTATAIVVCGDIALYPAGPARATGGAGAVAMLLGRNPPLRMYRQPTWHWEHKWDFYKPHPLDERPEVDGKGSLTCYLQTLRTCLPAAPQEDTRHILFHTPFAKMAAKAHAVLLSPGLDIQKPREVSAATKDQRIREDFDRRTSPSLLLARALGNSYTASLWMCLASVCGSLSVGDGVSLFSYGSGMGGASLHFRVTRSCGPLFPSREELQGRLSDRVEHTPTQFEEACVQRESLDLHRAMSDPMLSKLLGKPCTPSVYVPKGSIEGFREGTWYLDAIDEQSKRQYKCKE